MYQYLESLLFYSHLLHLRTASFYSWYKVLNIYIYMKINVRINIHFENDFFILDE